MKRVKLRIEEISEEIAGYLTSLQVLVRHRNASKLYDLNIHCEELFCDILNVVLDIRHPGIHLTSANTASTPNCAGIDLIDRSQKIIVQVTSSSTNKKVKHTFAEIKASKKYIGYTLYFMFIAGEMEKINLRSNRAPTGIVCKRENLLYSEKLVGLLQGKKDKCEKLFKILHENLDAVCEEKQSRSDCFAFINQIACLCKCVDHVSCMCDEYLQAPAGKKVLDTDLIHKINHQVSNHIPMALPDLMSIRQTWASHMQIYAALLQINDYVGKIDSAGRDIAYYLDVLEVSMLTNRLLELINRIIKMMCREVGIRPDVAFTELMIAANL